MAKVVGRRVQAPHEAHGSSARDELEHQAQAAHVLQQDALGDEPVEEDQRVGDDLVDAPDD